MIWYDKLGLARLPFSKEIDDCRLPIAEWRIRSEKLVVHAVRDIADGCLEVATP